MLGLSLSVVAVALSYLGRADKTQKTGTMQTQIVSLSQTIEEIYPGHIYTGLTPATLIQSQKLSSAMHDGTNVIDPFGGTMSFWAGSLNGVAGSAYVISLASVPVGPCTDLVQLNARSFTEISVFSSNGTTKVANKATNLVPTGATAAAACTGTGLARIDFVQGRL